MNDRQDELKILIRISLKFSSYEDFHLLIRMGWILEFNMQA